MVLHRGGREEVSHRRHLLADRDGALHADSERLLEFIKTLFSHQLKICDIHHPLLVCIQLG